MGARQTPPVIVGLDAGTTGVKVVAFAPGVPGRHLAVREYPLDEPTPGWQVQDPAVIVAACRAALAECVRAVGAAEVVAISLAAAMHGLLGLDAEFRPLTPLVTWADARAGDEARSLRHLGPAAELHRRTGVPVHPMSPLTKLVWFARNEPETFRAARWWIGLKDYLIYWLTGTLATELSSASGTGLVEMATRGWSPAALDVAGVSVTQLPEILSPTATLPLASAPAHEVGLPVATPVVVGAGDGPLGNLGTGAITPGIAGMSLGTSGAIRLAVAEPTLDADRTLFCYPLTESLWVVGGAVSNGAGVMSWVGRVLAPDLPAARGADRDAAVLALAAGIPPGSEGLVMVPYLLAERAPLWDADLAGAYLGLRSHHRRGHFVRAAVEGVCLQMRLILDRLDAVAPVDSVRATGGAFRSALWREVMAATLDRPLYVLAEEEGTALGAAALGLVALGRAPGLADALAQLTDPAAPEPAPIGTRPELVATYSDLRRSLRSRLNDLGAVGGLVDRSTDA